MEFPDWVQVKKKYHSPQWSDTHKGETVCMSSRRVRVSVKVLKVLAQES